MHYGGCSGDISRSILTVFIVDFLKVLPLGLSYLAIDVNGFLGVYLAVKLPELTSILGPILNGFVLSKGLKFLTSLD